MSLSHGRESAGHSAISSVHLPPPFPIYQLLQSWWASGPFGMWPLAAGGRWQEGEGRCVPLVLAPGSHTVCICRASCWQPGARKPTSPRISEDCLYLNVFVPQNLVSSEALAMFTLKNAPLEIPCPQSCQPWSLSCPMAHSGRTPQHCPSGIWLPADLDG